MTSSTSPSNVGLKVCTLAHFLHAPWAFEIYLEFLKLFMGLAQIPSIPHQISNTHQRFCLSLTTVYIPVFQQGLLS